MSNRAILVLDASGPLFPLLYAPIVPEGQAPVLLGSRLSEGGVMLAPPEFETIATATRVIVGVVFVAAACPPNHRAFTWV
jgi:hypothetical protein